MSTIKGFMAVIRWRNNGRIDALGLYASEREARSAQVGRPLDVIAIVPTEVTYAAPSFMDHLIAYNERRS